MAIPVFLVNLDRDADRLAHMSAEFARVGLGFERVPAVLGTALPDRLAGHLLAPDGAIASDLKRGEVGCYGSHLVIHERIGREGLGPAVLVVEDDCRLPDDLVPLLDALVATLPEGWDIVRLSNPAKRAVVPLAPLPGGRSLVRYSKIPNNTGAYLISPKGAAKFLAAPVPRRRAVDEDLRRPWEFGLDTWGVEPAPIVSNIFDSSIEAMESRGLSAPRPPKVLTGRTEGPLAGLGRAAYNIGVLGFGAWLRALLVNAVGRHVGLRFGLPPVQKR